MQEIYYRLALINSSSEAFTRLHVASVIETFQTQLKESLLATSDTIIAQTQEQDRDITEEVHETTLSSCIQLSYTSSSKSAALLTTLDWPLPVLTAQVAPLDMMTLPEMKELLAFLAPAAILVSLGLLARLCT